MSPLSVSQFLPSDVSFDLVIFDEASQVRPGDAINCIYRGKQLIIAGDQKQLPPTSFWTKSISDESDFYEEGQLEEYESILDLCKGSGAIPSLSLSLNPQINSVRAGSRLQISGRQLVGA